MSGQISPRKKLIVALDLSSVEAAQAMVARLGDAVGFYKIGMELAYCAGGLAFAQELRAQGKQIFIDLKLHDIANTVERATRVIAAMGATFLTVHAYPQTMAAARRGADQSDLKLLAVTVMTSYDDNDLLQAGYVSGVRDLVAQRASQAQEAGMDGLILSAEEVEAMRKLVGPDMALVTPGIRLADGDIGDQKRVVTPALAIAAGADYLVVGRPVVEAPDPVEATEAIVAEIASGLAIRDRRNRLA